MACFTIMVENLDHTYSHSYVEKDGSVSRTLVKPHHSHPYSHAVLVDFHTASEGQKINALLLAREFPEISFETSPLVLSKNDLETLLGALDVAEEYSDTRSLLRSIAHVRQVLEKRQPNTEED